ncbi:immunity 49 family protein [Lentzea sp. NBC_00516]|uniref:immunity 49 family protein n=1 Tax=Lentzea sp. NBC_00516 TaxID=2903582 RepID=UPI002E817FC1|nr:immunity 49 family protein [Lentzea sp. NBC_00516]WUD24756.1 immunity 49 family protein [Lentzea sp. NBC_00516]
MVEVSRHEVDPDWSAKQLEKIERRIEETVDSLPNVRTIALSGLMRDALSHLGHRCAVDPLGSNGDTWDSLCFAAEVGAAIYAVATAEEGTPVEITLRGKQIPVTATGPVYFASGGTWLTTNYLAGIARDVAKTEQLSAVPLEVLRASGSEEPDYVFLMVDMFQKFNLQQPGVHEALNAALKATAPDEIDPVHREHVRVVAFPQLNMFHNIINAGRAEQFNQALAEALELFRELWSTEENEESPNGYVAIGPLGLASIAHDADIPIEVTSEYLPPYLYNGSWTREGL